MLRIGRWNFYILMLCLILTTGMVACGGGGDDDNDSGTSGTVSDDPGNGESTENSAPVASAGTDQNVATGLVVILDGSSSSDPDGDALTYNWSFTSKPTGSAAMLLGTNAVNPTFTADVDGLYVVQLIVNDGAVDSAADDVVLTTYPAKTFGGLGTESGDAVVGTSDGGFVIVGYTNSYGAGGDDVYLIRTDSEGNELWSKTFGGAGNDYGLSVAETSDGGFVIVGYTNSYGAGGYDVYLIKTDSIGNELWSKTFGESQIDDIGRSVVVTSDGGYAIAGIQDYMWNYVYLIKTDSDGNELWSKTIGSGSSSYNGYSIAKTSDGGLVISGYITSDVYNYVYLSKTDSSGNLLWSKTFGDGHSGNGYSVAETFDGGLVIAGYTSSDGAGDHDAYLIRTDSEGNELWYKTFGGAGNDYGRSVKETLDGGFVIVGYTSSYGAGGDDVYLIRTDSEGNELWYKTFGGAGNDYGLSVAETSDGGFVMVGSASSFAPYDADILLIRTDSEGKAY